MVYTTLRPRLLEEYQGQFDAFLRVTAYTSDEAAALDQLQRPLVDVVVILPADHFGTITSGQQASLAQAATDLSRVEELLALARQAADTWDRAEVARLLRQARASVACLATALDELGPEAASLRMEVSAVQGRLEAAEAELERAGLLEKQPSGMALRERLGIDALAGQVERLSQALGQITALPPEVVVAPLTVEARNVAPLQPDIITYYAPSVLALLVQLAVGLWAACTGLLHWRLRAR